VTGISDLRGGLPTLNIDQQVPHSIHTLTSKYEGLRHTPSESSSSGEHADDDELDSLSSLCLGGPCKDLVCEIYRDLVQTLSLAPAYVRRSL
jgi:hypothetical protein